MLRQLLNSLLEQKQVVKRKTTYKKSEVAQKFYIFATPNAKIKFFLFGRRILCHSESNYVKQIKNFY